MRGLLFTLVVWSLWAISSSASAQQVPGINVTIAQGRAAAIQPAAASSLPPDFEKARELASRTGIPLATTLTDIITKSSPSIRSGVGATWDLPGPASVDRWSQLAPVGGKVVISSTRTSSPDNGLTAAQANSRTTFIDPRLLISEPALTVALNKGYTPRTVEFDARFEANVGRLANYSEPVPIRNERIWNGTQVLPDADPFMDSVAIVGNGRICSGTLIGPDLVVTAAHCFCNGVMDEVVVGSSVIAVVDRIRVKKDQSESFLACNQVSADISAGDVALLRLERPSSIPPRPIGNIRMVRDAAAIRAVGFGQTATNAIGFKYQVNIVIASHQCDGTVIQGLPDQQVYRCRPPHEMVAAGLNRDTCGGDSGGSIFVLGPDARLYLAAVTSRAVDLSGRCGPGGIYVLLPSPPIRGWLEARGVTFKE